MICSKCGHEIPDGKLMCENCGAEINIVPEFDIEIENSINETLSNIVEELNPSSDKETSNSNVKDVNISEDKSSKSKNNVKSKQEKFEEEFFSDVKDLRDKKSSKKTLLIVLAGFLVLLVLLAFAGFFIYKNYSVSFQINSAKNAMNKGEFDTCSSFLKKALDMSPDDLNNKYDIACIYGQIGDYDSSLELLSDCLTVNISDTKLKESIYDEIIKEYESFGDYVSIKKLLDECDEEGIKNKYIDYLSEQPVFNILTGTFDSPISIELTAHETASIFYTIDGSKPDIVNGIKYNGPILLESGEFLVRAVTVNKYNVISEESDGYYLIGPIIPDAPLIYPESGKYDKSIIVTIVIPDNIKVYYTIDGKTPIPEVSDEYLEPFELGVGNYNLSFISVSADGTCSETVNRSYTIELKAKVSEEIAKAVIMNMLKVARIIEDIDGNAFQNKGKYSLKTDSIIEIPNKGYYYKFDEYFTDQSGNVTQTGLLYAVSCDSGEGFRLGIDENNQWQLIPIG